MDVSQFYGVGLAFVLGVIAALIGWYLSGEPFSETKFLRTVALATFAALGLSVTGITGTYSTGFLSTLIGLLGSKGLNALKEIPANVKQEMQQVAQAAVDVADKKPPPA
jgi:Zn-dependent protease